MNRIRTTSAALLATAALTLGAAPSLADDAPAPAEPCATQQAQADRAQQALDRLTAVFARQKTRVAKARHEVATADTRAEKAQAKKALASAKAKKAKVAKAKKAQQQRVAKANQRLETCLAAQPALPA